MFQTVPSQVDFVAQEHAVLKFWADTDAFAKLVAKNRGRPRWSFIDGPITANNPMGVHHAWGRTYKDLFQRFKAMQGFDQRYQNGFDGQGLWVEVEVERELGFQTKRDIEAYGIAEFVQRCKERVFRFADLITQQSIRLGYWTDWDHSYHTLSDENNYTIWLFLKRCWERGLLYKGHDVMPWCPRCSTALSEHEIVTDGYEELTHPSLTVRFPLEGREGEYLLVWTTTPWTLTANVAAAVHPDLTYVQVRQGESIYFLAENRLEMLQGPYQVLSRLPGVALDGWVYRGPFDELPVQRGIEHRVILWEDVSEMEGTGIVHIAPGAGQEDFQLGQRYGLPVLAPLDEFGHFLDGYGWLTGESVSRVAAPIFQALRAKSRFYHVEDYVHRYPVCWRCHTELVFRLVDEWFISMEALRYEIMDVVEQIRWIPGFGLDRELDWLRNMGDWMISKKRYWGLALPIYDCPNCGHFEVIGSEVELKERAIEGWQEFEGHSPHRPWIDAVKIACSTCGAPVSRILDVGNPWLDAGIVPYSTLDYRHDRSYWEQWFPADFITESFPGQFRNWFYSLLVMSTVLEKCPPFETVMGYALLRDEQGEEMHKSRGNAIWFDDAAEQAGVDVMRWLFATHPIEQNLNFGYGATDEVRRRFIIPLWNVYSFFVTYANVDGWKLDTERRLPTSNLQPPTSNPLDCWILGKLQLLVQTVTDRLEDFDARSAALAVEAFVDDLSNWYVRRSRRRFWRSGDDADKQAAYATLYQVLVTLSKLLAPFVPFLAEAMYQNLVRTTNNEQRTTNESSERRPSSFDVRPAESVHLCDWPVPDEALVEQQTLAEMDLVVKLAGLGRAARGQANLKLRQPLAKLTVALNNPADWAAVERLAELLADEVNVKQIDFADGEGELVSFTVRPVLPKLGPKYGPLTPRIRQALASADASQVARTVQAGQPVELVVEGQPIILQPDEVEVLAVASSGYAVAEAGGLVVGVSTELTPDLVREGLAREVVRRIQMLRKNAGLELTDRIVTTYQADGMLAEAIEQFRDYVAGETLSVELVTNPAPNGAVSQRFDVEGRSLVLALQAVEVETAEAV
jgi:isoleucyl-tRNA synthetase